MINGFPPMKIHLDYPWVLNTIYMLMILIIFLKIRRPLANSTGNQSIVVRGAM